MSLLPLDAVLPGADFADPVGPRRPAGLPARRDGADLRGAARPGKGHRRGQDSSGWRMTTRPQIAVGDRFGLRTILSVFMKDHATRVSWKCECGNTGVIEAKYLTKGQTTSCGCLRNAATAASNKT